MALLCMHKVFPTLKGKQITVMSLDDITTVVLTLWVGSYIRRMHVSPRGSSLGFQLQYISVAIG